MPSDTNQPDRIGATPCCNRSFFFLFCNFLRRCFAIFFPFDCRTRTLCTQELLFAQGFGSCIEDFLVTETTNLAFDSTQTSQASADFRSDVFETNPTFMTCRTGFQPHVYYVLAHTYITTMRRIFDILRASFTRHVTDFYSPPPSGALQYIRNRQDRRGIPAVQHEYFLRGHVGGRLPHNSPH